MTKQAQPDFSTTIVTPIFRLSYPHLFEHHFNALGKRNQFDCQMLFDKKDKAALKPMYDLMRKVAEFKFGTNVKGLLNPIKDGDTHTNDAGELIKDKNPACAGMMVLGSWSKNQPGVVNAQNQIILNHDEVYGGCFCRAQLNCYAYEKGKNRGIAFGLQNIQKIKDGDSFGTRTRPEDAFSPIENAGSTAEEVEDTAGMFG